MNMSSGRGTKMDETDDWPFLVELQEATAQAHRFPDSDEDIAFVNAFGTSISKWVCTSCSGFGHVTTCWRKSKGGRNKGCPTHDLIDDLYKTSIKMKQ
jgi:hypothetical protein